VAEPIIFKVDNVEYNSVADFLTIPSPNLSDFYLLNQPTK
jgi:hypothetical protein